MGIRVTHRQAMGLREGRGGAGVLTGLALVLLILMGGCVVQSLQPFHEADSVIDSPVPPGQWLPVNEHGKALTQLPWTFQQDRVVAYDKSGIPGTLKITYFRVGGVLFADAVADDPHQVNEWWAMHVTPMHTVSRVELSGNTLTFLPLDYDWLVEGLKKQTIKLSHVSRKEENMITFTASPAEWTAFLRGYGRDEQAFPQKNALRFIKKGEPAAVENKG